MRTLASGVTVDGDSWKLIVGPAGPGPEGDWYGPSLGVEVDTIAGAHMGAGGGNKHLSGRSISLTTAVADGCPRAWLVLVADDVSRVQAQLSTGAIVPIELHSAQELGEMRAGLLLFDRALDVHRLDCFDANGNPVEDDGSGPSIMSA